MFIFSVRWPLLFSVCVLAACSPQSCSERIAEEAIEEAIEAETGAQVDIDAEGNEVTIRGPEGAELQMAGGDAIELPDDFPSAVPLYPGAVPVSFLRLGSEGIQATFQTEATASTVQNWYQEQLTDQGWEVQMNTTTPEGSMLMTEREGNTLVISVSGTGESETTLVVHFQSEG
jgi:hypothetical protein